MKKKVFRGIFVVACVLSVSTLTGCASCSRGVNLLSAMLFFDDANGKRVIIHGGIVISEEN